MHEGSAESWLQIEVHTLSGLASCEQVVLRLAEDVHREEMPEVKTNFEQLILWDGRALDEYHESFLHWHFKELDVLIVLHCVSAGLNQGQVLGECWADGQAHLLAQVLKVRLLLSADQRLKLSPEVSLLSNYVYLVDEQAKIHACLLFVKVHSCLLFFCQAYLGNFCEELDGFDSSACGLDEVSKDVLYQRGLEDVGEWDPWDECLESLQASSDQTLLDGGRVGQSLVNYPVAEVEETRKLIHHGGLEFTCLALNKSIFAEIKQFFGEKLQNV